MLSVTGIMFLFFYLTLIVQTRNIGVSRKLCRSRPTGLVLVERLERLENRYSETGGED